jgi:hypothetical protein
VAIDVSPTKLGSARDHFANDSKVKILDHDLSQPLFDDLGYFDAVVSSLRSIILDVNVSVDSTKKYMILLIQQECSVIQNTLHHPSVELHVRFSRQLDIGQKKKTELIDCCQWKYN